MSTLWTPYGEHEPVSHLPGEEATDPTAAPRAPAGEEAEEALRQAREELARTPTADVVANHVIGLWQLALIHLGIDREIAEPNLPEAQLAIDAIAALVDGLDGRLGDHETPLREALAQLRLAYVKVGSPVAGEDAAGPDAGDGDES